MSLELKFLIETAQVRNARLCHFTRGGQISPFDVEDLLEYSKKLINVSHRIIEACTLSKELAYSRALLILLVKDMYLEAKYLHYTQE